MRKQHKENEPIQAYLGILVVRKHNLRKEGKEFEALEVEKIIEELAKIFNLEEFL